MPVSLSILWVVIDHTFVTSCLVHLLPHICVCGLPSCSTHESPLDSRAKYSERSDHCSIVKTTYLVWFLQLSRTVPLTIKVLWPRSFLYIDSFGAVPCYRREKPKTLPGAHKMQHVSILCKLLTLHQNSIPKISTSHVSAWIRVGKSCCPV